MSTTTEPPKLAQNEPKDSHADHIKLEDDFYEFNKLMNENMQMENDIEKQLENEDKKCTFLKHIVDELRKQFSDAEKVSEEQRKLILHQQMELEQISSSIFQQKEQIKIESMEEGLLHYSESVNVLAEMLRYIKDLKITLKNDLDEVNQNNELNEWKSYIDQLKTRILDDQAKKHQLEIELEHQNCQDNSDLLEEIKKNSSILQMIYNEYKNLSTDLIDKNNVKKQIEERSQELTVEFENRRNDFSKALDSIRKITVSYEEEIEYLRNHFKQIEEYRFVTIQDLNSATDPINQQFKNIDDLIQQEKSTLQTLIEREIDLKSENQQLFLKIDAHKEHHSKLEMNVSILREKKETNVNIRNAVRAHMNFIENSISNGEAELQYLNEEFCQLKNTCLALAAQHGENDINIDSCNRIIDKIQNDVIKCSDEIRKLERDQHQIKQEIDDSRLVEEKLKIQINAYDAEYVILENIFNNLYKKIHEKEKQEENETNKRLQICMENVAELDNNLIEKYLFRDTLQTDVQKSTELVPSLQCKIWMKKNENKEKQNKVSQLENFINKEENNLQTKIRLLEDLQKNTFLCTELPKDWCQFFDQSKKDFEKLRKEKAELEKELKRLNISIETEKELKKRKNEMKLSELFKNEKSEKQTLDPKNVAFEMFKKRVSKKGITSLANKV